MERAIEFHTRACNGGVERACDDLAQINGDHFFRSGREGRTRPTRPSDSQLANAGSGVDASVSNRRIQSQQAANGSLKVTRYVSDNDVVETIEPTIAARASFSWDRSFVMGDMSVLGAESDNNVTLGIEVFDVAGKEVCRGTLSSEVASCVFTPTSSGLFRVKVTNHSGSAARVSISAVKTLDR